MHARDGEVFRQALRPGTVLDLRDGALVTVKAVTPEGIIADDIVSRDVLRTWRSLELDSAIIHRQPAEGEIPMNTVPKLRRRAAVLPVDTSGDRYGEPGMPEERAMARELARLLAARGHAAGTLEAHAEHPNGAWGYVAAGPDGQPIDAPTIRPLLEAHVARLRDTGMPAVLGYVLTYTPREEGGWYEVRFRYEGE